MKIIKRLIRKFNIFLFTCFLSRTLSSSSGQHRTIHGKTGWMWKNVMMENVALKVFFLTRCEGVKFVHFQFVPVSNEIELNFYFSGI